MCGRYALTSSADVLAEIFDLAQMPALEARYNIAPSQAAPVVRVDSAGNRVVAMFRWGLVPFWTKDPAAASAPINARSESAATKPTFREALRRRRCLVPADGFYEWQKRGKTKQPYFAHPRDGRPYAMAGIYERWRDDAGEALHTFAILTTEANDLLRPLHDRMPVVVPHGDYARWLDRDEQDPAALASILRPADEDFFTVHPVSRHVNTPAHDDPRCIEAVEIEAEPAGEPTLFDEHRA